MESGIHPAALPDGDLFRELRHMYQTRLETLRHGSAHALATHLSRMQALEHEYLRRFPHREIKPERLRAGARTRDHLSLRRLSATSRWL
jgi:Family of unknown function (DUF6158)